MRKTGQGKNSLKNNSVIKGHYQSLVCENSRGLTALDFREKRFSTDRQARKLFPRLHAGPLAGPQRPERVPVPYFNSFLCLATLHWGPTVCQARAGSWGPVVRVVDTPHLPCPAHSMPRPRGGPHMCRLHVATVPEAPGGLQTPARPQGRWSRRFVLGSGPLPRLNVSLLESRCVN